MKPTYNTEQNNTNQETVKYTE